MLEQRLIQLENGKLAVATGICFGNNGELLVSLEDYLFEYCSNKEELLVQIDQLRQTISEQEPLSPKQYFLQWRPRRPMY